MKIFSVEPVFKFESISPKCLERESPENYDDLELLIKKAINICIRLDIGLFRITKDDILNALVTAQEKGGNIDCFGAVYYTFSKTLIIKHRN